MCNWSENIWDMAIQEGIEEGIQKGMERGIEKGIQKERLNAIERMIRAGIAKEQIISFGYTEEEFAEAEGILCANA